MREREVVLEWKRIAVQIGKGENHGRFAFGGVREGAIITMMPKGPSRISIHSSKE